MRARGSVAHLVSTSWRKLALASYPGDPGALTGDPESGLARASTNATTSRFRCRAPPSRSIAIRHAASVFPDLRTSSTKMTTSASADIALSRQERVPTSNRKSRTPSVLAAGAKAVRLRRSKPGRMKSRADHASIKTSATRFRRPGWWLGTGTPRSLGLPSASRRPTNTRSDQRMATARASSSPPRQALTRSWARHACPGSNSKTVAREPSKVPLNAVPRSSSTFGILSYARWTWGDPGREPGRPHVDAAWALRLRAGRGLIDPSELDQPGVRRVIAKPGARGTALSCAPRPRDASPGSHRHRPRGSRRETCTLVSGMPGGPWWQTWRRDGSRRPEASAHATHRPARTWIGASTPRQTGDPSLGGANPASLTDTRQLDPRFALVFEAALGIGSAA